MLHPCCTLFSSGWGKTSSVWKRWGIIWIFSVDWPVQVMKCSWSQCGPSRRSTCHQEKHWSPGGALASGLGTSAGSAASDCSRFLSLWRHPDRQSRGHLGALENLGNNSSNYKNSFLCSLWYFLNACVQLRGGKSGHLIAAYKLSRSRWDAVGC